MVKGFVMDDARLKNPNGRPDYFDELLERIRDIRASEKRFYQKVRDLLALSRRGVKIRSSGGVYAISNPVLFTKSTKGELSLL